MFSVNALLVIMMASCVNLIQPRPRSLLVGITGVTCVTLDETRQRNNEFVLHQTSSYSQSEESYGYGYFWGEFL